MTPDCPPPPAAVARVAALKAAHAAEHAAAHPDAKDRQIAELEKYIVATQEYIAELKRGRNFEATSLRAENVRLRADLATAGLALDELTKGDPRP
jgi:hypothetical protein